MGATMVKNGNLLDALPSQGTLHVVMLGLDSAGKTTALYRLKFDQYLNTVPTIGFNCEKVHGTIGKAKGVHFLVWDVGGQEKLRPLWRSYTRYEQSFYASVPILIGTLWNGATKLQLMFLGMIVTGTFDYVQEYYCCTDGILFVVDSVDTERMEEAKMELMRTAKCPDNQGVPVLILANKQDLPNACCPKELEKLLGLHELLHPMSNISKTPFTDKRSESYINQVKSPDLNNDKSDRNIEPSLEATTSTIPQPFSQSSSQLTLVQNQPKGWYIQPACAITGEGLQEGLDALYDMILKRRKLNKSHKKHKR